MDGERSSPGSAQAASGAFPSQFHEVENEVAVLGCLLRDNAQADRVADILKAEDFAEPLFGTIYDIMLREIAATRPAIPSTIAAMFVGDPAFEELHGRRLLNEAAGSVAALLPATQYALAVAEIGRRRRLWLKMQASSAALENASFPVSDVMADHEAALATEAGLDSKTVFRSAADCVDEVVASFGRSRVGITSGVVEGLDRLVGQIRPGWLGILAARPGAGKTATMLSYLRGAAANGHCGLYVSLEVGWETLATRIVSDHCYSVGQPIKYGAIMGGSVQPHELREICRSKDALSALPYRIVDKGCETIGGLRRAIRRYKRYLVTRGETLGLVMIDYLQLLSPDQAGLQETEAVTQVSRQLKLMAIAEDVAIIAAAQLNREVEKRETKRPILPDLRSSGQIEADADFVIFLLSKEYYHRENRPAEADPKFADWEARLREIEHELEFICAKFRHGSTGNFFGRFYRAYQAVR